MPLLLTLPNRSVKAYGEKTKIPLRHLIPRRNPPEEEESGLPPLVLSVVALGRVEATAAGRRGAPSLAFLQSAALAAEIGRASCRERV